MSTFVYDQAVADVAGGVINLASDNLKLILVTSGYSPSKADNTVDTASAAEISATNYTGGYGGAGRKSLGRSVVKDTSANAVRVIFAGNVTWTGIGGGTNATIAAAVLVKETGGSDASSRLVAYFQLSTPIMTNGSDFTLTVDGTAGNITFTL